MAITADAVSRFVLLYVWTCLTDTPSNQKNSFFARFLTSFAVIEELASKASLVFAPGLLEVFQSVTPPTIQFFKSLPTEHVHSSIVRWGIYVIVLEKSGCRPRIIIGSGTNSSRGVKARLNQYDDGAYLPVYVKTSLDAGFTIVYKGLLCWMPNPRPVNVPVFRLLMFALEATLSYMFWAMRTPSGADYGMSHVCVWDRQTMEYDGLCSHCALNEGIRGNFEMTADELEAYAVEMEEKRLALKAINATNHHFRQMAENYDEYIGEAGVRVARSRANNPGRDKVRQADRITKATLAKTFHCVLCNIPCGTQQRLDNHLKTAKHLRKHKEGSNPFRCVPCNLGFHNKSNQTRHDKTERHAKAVAAAAASST